MVEPTVTIVGTRIQNGQVVPIYHYDYNVPRQTEYEVSAEQRRQAGIPVSTSGGSGGGSGGGSSDGGVSATPSSAGEQLKSEEQVVFITPIEEGGKEGTPQASIYNVNTRQFRDLSPEVAQAVVNVREDIKKQGGQESEYSFSIKETNEGYTVAATPSRTRPSIEGTPLKEGEVTVSPGVARKLGLISEDEYQRAVQQDIVFTVDTRQVEAAAAILEEGNLNIVPGRGFTPAKEGTRIPIESLPLPSERPVETIQSARLRSFLLENSNLHTSQIEPIITIIRSKILTTDSKSITITDVKRIIGEEIYKNLNKREKAQLIAATSLGPKGFEYVSKFIPRGGSSQDVLYEVIGERYLAGDPTVEKVLGYTGRSFLESIPGNVATFAAGGLVLGKAGQVIAQIPKFGKPAVAVGTAGLAGTYIAERGQAFYQARDDPGKIVEESLRTVTQVTSGLLGGGLLYKTKGPLGPKTETEFLTAIGKESEPAIKTVTLRNPNEIENLVSSLQARGIKPEVSIKGDSTTIKWRENPFFDIVTKQEIMTALQKGKIIAESPQGRIVEYKGLRYRLEKTPGAEVTELEDVNTVVQGSRKFLGKFKGFDVYVEQTLKVPVKIRTPEGKFEVLVKKPKGPPTRNILEDLSKFYKEQSDAAIRKAMADHEAVIKNSMEAVSGKPATQTRPAIRTQQSVVDQVVDDAMADMRVALRIDRTRPSINTGNLGRIQPGLLGGAMAAIDQELQRANRIAFDAANISLQQQGRRERRIFQTVQKTVQRQRQDLLVDITPMMQRINKEIEQVVAQQPLIRTVPRSPPATPGRPRRIVPPFGIDFNADLQGANDTINTVLRSVSNEMAKIKALL